MRVMSEQTVKVTKNPTKVPHITSIKAFLTRGRRASSQEKIKITAKKPQKENEKKSRNNISLNRIKKGKHARLECVCVCLCGVNESGIQIKMRRSWSNCCGGLMSSQNPWPVVSFWGEGEPLPYRPDLALDQPTLLNWCTSAGKGA